MHTFDDINDFEYAATGYPIHFQFAMALRRMCIPLQRIYHLGVPSGLGMQIHYRYRNAAIFGSLSVDGSMNGGIQVPIPKFEHLLTYSAQMTCTPQPDDMQASLNLD